MPVVKVSPSSKSLDRLRARVTREVISSLREDSGDAGLRFHLVRAGIRAGIWVVIRAGTSTG